MDDDARALRHTVKVCQRNYSEANIRLANFEANCEHDWNVVREDIIHRGYHVDAFEAGSDSTPAMDVPERREPRWQRTCERCGKVEYTTVVLDHTTQTPVFVG